jgi:uncharacterized membrane-anchored protein
MTESQLSSGSDAEPGAAPEQAWGREHPLRQALVQELHARPPVSLSAPARATHLSVLSGEAAAEADRAHVASLCTQFEAPPPASGARHYAGPVGPFRLKWERHTEFSTYTFLREGPLPTGFEDPAIGLVPEDWLAALPGEVLTATHVVVEPGDAPERTAEALARLFGDRDVFASHVLGGAATVWTDLGIHGDGFSRLLVRDQGLSPRQAGRLNQDLLEIFTYSVMALLALPRAREAGPRIGEIDESLAGFTGQMSTLEGIEAERAMLADLSRLAAELEALGALTNFRFGAARAYYAIVQMRLEELREERLEGYQTIAAFMERRLAPAMRTCDSTARRLDELSGRINRVGDLLRTRVDIALEQQNQELLQSMNRRARLQLRLQQTVEGLSIAAISYYLVSLVGYALSAARGAGVDLNVNIGRGFAIPVVILVAWLVVRRVRRAIMGRAGEASE